MTKRSPNRKDVPWNKRQEIPDPQILDAANQYGDACKLLDSQPPDSGVHLPAMNTAAIAVELYLKCLSAEAIWVEDDLMPEMSRVYAAPERGHGLVSLCKAMPQDVRTSLIEAFDTEFGNRRSKDLWRVLKEFGGAFQETRYPYEHGMDITRYNHTELMELAEFLGRFANNLPPKEYIDWK